MVAKKKLELTGRIEKSLKRKKTRRRLVRYSLVGINVAILALVIGFVFASSHPASTVANDLVSANSATNVDKPIDKLTSYDIASNIAQLTDLPEQKAIANQAQSAKVSLYVSMNSVGVNAKPQIVTTALKSRKDIHSYTVQSGDTVSSIAQKFGITSDSILWSNSGIYGNRVNAGTVLTIPPVDGIVYTVKLGDTPQSLAQKYHASVQEIVAYNDAELKGLTPGEKIIIPNGSISPVYQSTSLNFIPIYGGDEYDPGWCTYYAAGVAHVPNNWGDAKTWAFFARLSGWTVSSRPVPGAVVQTSIGNHVGIVQKVSPDGTQITYSDMNGIAGFNHVGYSGWVSAANGFDGGQYPDVVYIYR